MIFLGQLFNDATKFEILNKDPILCSLSTIQKYLNTIELRGEIKKNENKQKRPKFAQIGIPYGLPEIHKQFVKVPSFQSIIGTIITPHYRVGKFLTNPHKMNILSKVSLIYKIPLELFEQGY